MTYHLEASSVETEPMLLFDKVDTSMVAGTPYDGLSRFASYTKDVPHLNVVTLAPSDKLADLNRVVHNLNSGTRTLQGGMQRFFRSRLELVDSIPVQDERDPASYLDGARTISDTYNANSVDIVLAYAPDWGRYRLDAPYNQMKTFFATYGFVTQMVSDRTLQNLHMRDLNLALAVFAKAGGIPWVLRDQFRDTDMVIGIDMSYAISGRRRAGTRRRYIGYVNVFDRFGRWMFFEGFGASATMEERHQKLATLLRDAISRFRAEKGSLPAKIQIHYFKRFGETERRTILEVLQDCIPDVRVAYVSIDDSHGLRFYDITTPDGSFPRGAYVYLTDKEILLSTTGHHELGGYRQMGTPVLSRILVHQHPDQFIGLDQIAHQVLALTKLNWGSVARFAREPVSLLFARRIAYLIGIIQESAWQGLVEAAANPQLRNRPWFI